MKIRLDNKRYFPQTEVQEELMTHGALYHEMERCRDTFLEKDDEIANLRLTLDKYVAWHVRHKKKLSKYNIYDKELTEWK